MMLAACTAPREQAATLVGQRGWRQEVVETPAFALFAARPRAFAPGQALTVYVEGDGFAWINRNRLSDDPTPRKPVALELAVRDPSANVVYLGRPCQYVDGPQRRNCSSNFWSTARYSEPVVAAVSSAIDHFMAQSGAREVTLVGHSGGGTVALLVAAHRADVRRVVTVAGVLDSDTWTRLDGLTPLWQSMNPANMADRLASVPQHHFAGAADTVVPIQVARAYLERFPPPSRPSLTVVPGQGHECCWADLWPGLLKQIPTPGP